MSYFDMLRFQGFVAGAIAEGLLVAVVSVTIILIKAIKNRRAHWY